MRKTYDGSCHCKKVTFRVNGDLDQAIKCNCSICRMKGFLHLIVPPADFQLLRGEDELSIYRFNTGIAQHKFCRTCGVHPFYTPRSDPDKVDVNVNCLDGVDVALLSPRLFDGANWEEAIKTHRQ